MGYMSGQLNRFVRTDGLFRLLLVAMLWVTDLLSHHIFQEDLKKNMFPGSYISEKKFISNQPRDREWPTAKRAPWKQNTLKGTSANGNPALTTSQSQVIELATTEAEGQSQPVYDDAYCCLDDDGEESCCVTYYYYQTWWFWFMWGFFLMILVSCFVGCYRACRTRRNRYVILGQQAPVYGSVVVSSTMHTQQAGMASAPTAPVAPPAYVPYPQEKPPAYAAAHP